MSDEEYAQLKALAGRLAMSEWAREVLVRELDGRQARPAERILLAGAAGCSRTLAARRDKKKVKRKK